MSEFRIFCIVVFVSGGLLCAASNRGWELKDGSAGILLLSITVGCAAIALFGRRS